MKNLIVLLLVMFAFVSCDKEALEPQETKQDIINEKKAAPPPYLGQASFRPYLNQTLYEHEITFDEINVGYGYPAFPSSTDLDYRFTDQMQSPNVYGGSWMCGYQYGGNTYQGGAIFQMHQYAIQSGGFGDKTWKFEHYDDGGTTVLTYWYYNTNTESWTDLIDVENGITYVNMPYCGIDLDALDADGYGEMVKFFSSSYQVVNQ